MNIDTNINLKINIHSTGLCTLCTRYIHDENMGSLAFTTILNNYIGAVAREVYRNEGDVLKFTGATVTIKRVGEQAANI